MDSNLFRVINHIERYSIRDTSDSCFDSSSKNEYAQPLPLQIAQGKTDKFASLPSPSKSSYTSSNGIASPPSPSSCSSANDRINKNKSFYFVFQDTIKKGIASIMIRTARDLGAKEIIVVGKSRTVESLLNKEGDKFNKASFVFFNSLEEVKSYLNSKAVLLCGVIFQKPECIIQKFCDNPFQMDTAFLMINEVCLVFYSNFRCIFSPEFT